MVDQVQCCRKATVKSHFDGIMRGTASFQGVGSKGKPLGCADGKSFDLCRMLVLAKVETFPLLCLNKSVAQCVVPLNRRP